MAKSVLLFTEDIDSAGREIVEVGGKISQQFTESTFVASLPETVDPRSLTQSNPDRPDSLDAVSALAVDAWNAR